jgi:cytoskeletal protein CcmA (bactofilin family)
LVAPGTKVVGKVSGAAEVVVEGELEGEIRVDGGAVIGTGGTVRGEISARTVRVGGKVFGNIRGAERVEVLASGALEGDVSAPRVVIAEGAFFKGKVEMTGGKADEKK